MCLQKLLLFSVIQRKKNQKRLSLFRDVYLYQQSDVFEFQNLELCCCIARGTPAAQIKMPSHVGRASVSTKAPTAYGVKGSGPVSSLSFCHFI